jgi:hypothetical protein
MSAPANLSAAAIAASKLANKSNAAEGHAAAQRAHIAARSAVPRGKLRDYHERAIHWHAIAYAKAVSK